MHWHIKGWINLGALQELSTEALSGFVELPVSPTSKPRDLWFPDSFPNSLLIHFMSLCTPCSRPGELVASPALLECQNMAQGRMEAPGLWNPLPGTEHLPVPSLTLSTNCLRWHPSVASHLNIPKISCHDFMSSRVQHCSPLLPRTPSCSRAAALEDFDHKHPDSFFILFYFGLL